jgi:integrase
MLSPAINLRKRLDAACDAVGVARMRVHDLRHANASLWLMAGGSLTDVQRNLGHSTPVITSEMYAHITDDHRVQEAAARLTLGIGKPGPRDADDAAGGKGTT